MWKDLFKAHCDLTVDSVISSDLMNRYKSILYIFPAAVSVMSINAVSDVLINCCCWSNLLIIMKKWNLLFGDAVAWETYVIIWRCKALNQVIKTFLYIQKMKKKIFSEKNFFLTKKNRHLDKNDNEQNTNIADNYDKNFVHDLKLEYMKKQNIVIANSKTRFATSFWWFFIDSLFTNPLKWTLGPVYWIRWLVK